MTDAAQEITAVLAGNVHRRREHQRMSQGDLARAAKVSQGMVNLIERGLPEGRDVSMRIVECLARGLGTTPRVLLVAPDCEGCFDITMPGFLCLECGRGERRTA